MSHLDDVPKNITAEWIAQDSELLFHVELYMAAMMKHVREQGVPIAEMVDRLPHGYGLLFLHWRCWTDVHNGGFCQFVGNALAVDGSGKILLDTLAALNELGANDLAAMAREAMRIMSQWIPRDVATAIGSTSTGQGTMGATGGPITPEIEQQLDRLDDEFSELNYSWFKRVTEFIRTHAEMFIHAGIAEAPS